MAGNQPLLKCEASLGSLGWTDFSKFIQQRTSVGITRGRQNQSQTISPQTATFQVSNRDGRFTIRNPNGTWFGKIVQNTPVRISVPQGQVVASMPSYLRLENDVNGFMSTPDSAPLQITSGTLSVAIDLDLSDSRACTLIGKWGTTTPTKGWYLAIGGPAGSVNTAAADGCLQFGWNGSSFLQAVVSTVPIPYYTGRIALRCDWNMATGFATFSWAPTMAGPWTVLGVPVSGNQISPHFGVAAASGQRVQVGSLDGISGASVLGAVYEARLYAGQTWTDRTDNAATRFTVSPGAYTTTSTTAGDLLVATVTVGTGQTVTMPAGWTTATFADDGVQTRTYVFYMQPATNTGGITSVSVTFGGGFCDVQISAFNPSGSSSSVSVQQLGTATVAGSNTLALATTSGAGLNVAGDLLYAGVSNEISPATGVTFAAPPLTVTSGITSATFAAHMSGFQGVAGPGAQTATVVSTPTSGTIAQQSGVLAVFTTGGFVADAVFSNQTPGATSFTDSHSNTWSLPFGNSGELSGNLYRFHGELNSTVKGSDPAQTDLIVTAQAQGILSRLQSASTPADSALKRAWVRRPPNLLPVAYWPMEDGSVPFIPGIFTLAQPSNQPTQFGSATGGQALIPRSATTLPTFASFTGFACALSLPVMNGANCISYLTGVAATWTDNVVRFLMAVPAGGDSATNKVCMRLVTSGTVNQLDLVYTTASSGTLTVNGYDNTRTLLFTQAVSNFGLHGGLFMISVELTSETGSHFALQCLPAGSTSAAAGFSTAFTGSIGTPTSIQLGGGLVTTAMGHLAIQPLWEPVTDLASPLAAWAGETAGTRFARLCSEEGYNCRLLGAAGMSEPMGPQTAETISSLLQECESTDQGLIYEPRQILGLGYITRAALYNQPPIAVADYSQAEVMPALAPAADNQFTINDVTAQNLDGGTSRQFLPSGPMSVLAPPLGISRLDTSISVNAAVDTALPGLAGWYLHVRSADEDRYPDIPFQMARAGTPPLIPFLDIGAYLQVINTPTGVSGPAAWIPPGPIRQLVAGYSETFFSSMPGPEWLIDVNGVPEVPYEVVRADMDKVDTSSSVLAVPVTSGATSLTVAPCNLMSWTTAASDLPFDIRCGGERMTVTNIAALAVNNVFSDGFEAGQVQATAWAALGVSSQPAQSSVQAHSGTQSAVVTFNGTASPFMRYQTRQLIAPGELVQLLLWVWTAGTGFTLSAAADFFDINGNFLTTVTGTFAAPTASTWTEYFLTGSSPSQFMAAPAGAYQMQIGWGVSGTPSNGTLLYTDDVLLTADSQVFTVTRSVNGVVKAQADGTPIALWRTPVIAR